MQILKFLATGVNSWIQYEFVCGRGSLLTERYLSKPIGEILHNWKYERWGRKSNGLVSQSSIQSIIPEYPYPNLVKTSRGPKWAMDYGLIEEINGKESVRFAIETKFYGSRLISGEEVLKDIIRLAQLNYSCDSKCFLIVSGQNSKKGKQIGEIKKYNHKLYRFMQKGIIRGSSRIDLKALDHIATNNIYQEYNIKQLHRPKRIHIKNSEIHESIATNLGWNTVAFEIRGV